MRRWRGKAVGPIGVGAQLRLLRFSLYLLRIKGKENDRCR